MMDLPPVQLAMNNPPAIYEKMQDLSQGDLKKAVTGLNLRIVTQRQTAISLGVRGGLWWRSRKIVKMMESRSRDLDIFFNFAPLMIQPNVLPPIVSRVEDDVRVDGSGQSMRQILATYRIIRDARFVTVTPLWRDWLVWSAPKPDFSAVPKAILPKNGEEKKAWKEAVREGWKMGEKQADMHFRKKLRVLVRDYIGMLNFLALEREGLVSMPMIGEGRYGIMVGRKTLKDGVNEFRVTVPSQFKPIGGWKSPVINAN